MNKPKLKTGHRKGRRAATARDQVLSLCLSVDEAFTVDFNAALQGLTRSAYLTQLVLKALNDR